MRPMSPGKFGDSWETIGGDAVPTGEDLFDHPSERGLFVPTGLAQGFQQAKDPGCALKDLPGARTHSPASVSSCKDFWA
jgi:hypothetical protein